MNLNKRFLLITALALGVFAAIALGPAYNGSATHAGITHAVVVLTCSDSSTSSGNPIGVYAASSSDPSVTLPLLFNQVTQTSGATCATALQEVSAQGFTVLPAVGGAGNFNVWTLIR